ncbi:S49 family peptidase, partial [Halorubrum sp. SD612]|uniref:S49 family peptidase n=1 Tax=Halorubrum sp. SD612 TaxID=1855863 RepID=UPI00117A9628
VAYATDTCASGGYWIAGGCDELWAREASLVGSIGVVGSRPNAKGLADKLGISYEQFTAGEYKDAGVPLKEIEEDEREYLQGIIDGYYEQFVETVSEGRDMDPEDIRETEARVYLGDDAAEMGLVDELGTEDDVEDRLADLIGAEPEVREFTPERGLAERLGIGAERVGFAAGSGVAGVFADDGGDVDVELR